MRTGRSQKIDYWQQMREVVTPSGQKRAPQGPDSPLFPSHAVSVPVVDPTILLLLGHCWATAPAWCPSYGVAGSMISCPGYCCHPPFRHPSSCLLGPWRQLSAILSRNHRSPNPSGAAAQLVPNPAAAVSTCSRLEPQLLAVKPWAPGSPPPPPPFPPPPSVCPLLCRRRRPLAPAMVNFPMWLAVSI